jgi:hypothetical protein
VQTQNRSTLTEVLADALKVYEEANADDEANSMDVPALSIGENDRISPALSDASIVLDKGNLLLQAL